ncbi:4246_t:CDS:2 [Gigaspora margarita]|uniref:4246_t:CDS:1 n=1 Tax=Gigaspora margarita TaxID=4874 RepID=A0ABN7V1N8_GIGMA|nr:4246_t:CDS:2 [Gigaspora margarita]
MNSEDNKTKDLEIGIKKEKIVDISNVLESEDMELNKKLSALTVAMKIESKKINLKLVKLDLKQ